ncbi:MAG: pyridoxamine 5'-phosphate oxidase family protein [Sporolactobacillus sp.]
MNPSDHNFHLRKKERACTDQDRINHFLKNAKVGFLGLVDAASPYVVPVNFVWSDGKVFFHGAEDGRKADILRQHPVVCFTVAEEYAILVDAVPAHTTTAYFSVMLFGTVDELENPEEKTTAMQQLLDKYAAGRHEHALAAQHIERYRSALGSPTGVFALNVRQLTAKEHPVDPERVYRPSESE